MSIKDGASSILTLTHAAAGILYPLSHSYCTWSKARLLCHLSTLDGLWGSNTSVEWRLAEGTADPTATMGTFRVESQRLSRLNVAYEPELLVGQRPLSWSEAEGAHRVHLADKRNADC